MIGLLCFALAVLASPFKSKLRLEAENAALRHQLMFCSASCMALCGLQTAIAGSLSSFIAVSRLYFRFLQSSAPRRSSAGTGLTFAAIGVGSHDLWAVGPQIEIRLRALIRQMSIENPLWDAPRIRAGLAILYTHAAEHVWLAAGHRTQREPKRSG